MQEAQRLCKLVCCQRLLASAEDHYSFRLKIDNCYCRSNV